MKGTIRNNLGELEIDPHNAKAKHERWLLKITSVDGTLDLHTFKNISPKASELVTRYTLDLSNGKNLAKGQKKGRRSYNHLFAVRHRLSHVISIIERISNKELIGLDDDDVISVFSSMRDGTLLNKKGKPFLSVYTYAKTFAAFWRWIVRTQKKEGIIIQDIVMDLDTTADRKPKWEYFGLKEVEKMANHAPNYLYKTLLYFLFDSGIRAPKEMLNVRVKDITPVPNTEILFLNIREETSKTFGRKIKLMICSEMLRTYIKQSGLKHEDFLFSVEYVVASRIISKIGFEALKIGEEYHTLRKKLVRDGITMYDFRHNSVCHYLPIYKSENQMKYRYGWKKSEMIHYYSEFMGMKDTITDDDMLIDTTKTELQQELEKSKMKVAFLEEQMASKTKEMEERMKNMEAMMLQKFAESF